MINGLIVLLASNVLALRSDSSSDDSSRHNVESSSFDRAFDKDHSENEEARLFIGKLSRHCDERSELKAIVNLKPMIDAKHVHKSKRMLPFIEFANIAQFMVTIPDKKKLFPLFDCHKIDALVKIASRTTCLQNYDAFNAFFYNSDSLTGVHSLEFDSNFILYFLVRFYFFLDLFHCEMPCIIKDSCVFTHDLKTEVSLLCVPSKYININFGSSDNELRLFNSIITDTIISKFVVDFINILLKQIEVAMTKKHYKHTKKTFTTYTTYVTLLKSYLETSIKISEFNVQTKVDFLNQSKTFVFAEIPIKIKNVDNGEEESSAFYSSESESNNSKKNVFDGIFVGMLDFITQQKLQMQEDTKISLNTAVYTKQGIARFL